VHFTVVTPHIAVHVIEAIRHNSRS